MMEMITRSERSDGLKNHVRQTREQVSDVINWGDCSFISLQQRRKMKIKKSQKFGSKNTHMIMNLNYNIIR